MSSSSSELDKMLSGELYQAWDKQLVTMRQRAKQLCYELNQTSPLEEERRKTIIGQLLGGKKDAATTTTTTAHIESPFYCDYGCHLIVGENFYANHGCTILDCAQITIGNNCLLAPGVVISSATHPLNVTTRINGLELAYPITIGNNVWIGSNATINPGITIGNNVVIGAGAVVTKNIPNNVIVAGVPAKIIRTLTEEETTTTNSIGNDNESGDDMNAAKEFPN